MNTVLYGSKVIGPEVASANNNDVEGGHDWGNYGASNQETNMIVPVAGTISSFRVNHTTAPGAGKNFAYTMLKNGLATALTATLADANTSVVDEVNTFTVAAGDSVKLQTVPSGTPTQSANRWSMLFTPDTAAEGCFIVMSDKNDNLPADNTTYYFPVGRAAYKHITEGLRQSVCPTPGTFQKFYIRLDTAPGAGKSRTFTLRKNGADTAVTLTISDTATTGNSGATSVTVVAGDKLSWAASASGTPAGARPVGGIMFVPDVTGNQPIFGFSETDPSTGSTEYAEGVRGGESPWGSSTDRYLLMRSGILKSLYVSCETAPGVGKQYAYSLNINEVNSAVSLVIADTNTSANDQDGVYISDNDRLRFESSPTGTPATPLGLHWGFVFAVRPKVGSMLQMFK